MQTEKKRKCKHPKPSAVNRDSAPESRKDGGSRKKSKSTLWQPKPLAKKKIPMQNPTHHTEFTGTTTGASVLGDHHQKEHISFSSPHARSLDHGEKAHTEGSLDQPGEATILRSAKDHVGCGSCSAYLILNGCILSCHFVRDKPALCPALGLGLWPSRGLCTYLGGLHTAPLLYRLWGASH